MNILKCLIQFRTEVPAKAETKTLASMKQKSRQENEQGRLSIQECISEFISRETIPLGIVSFCLWEALAVEYRVG